MNYPTFDIECDPKDWKEWEIKYRDSLEEVEKLILLGHSKPCAIRQLFGDGECTCSLGTLDGNI
jgi:hypothetical protein